VHEDTDAATRNAEGRLLLDAGEYEGAIAALDEAIALCPDLAEAYWNRAEAHRRQGREATAAADSRRAADIEFSRMTRSEQERVVAEAAQQRAIEEEEQGRRDMPADILWGIGAMVGGCAAVAIAYAFATWASTPFIYVGPGFVLFLYGLRRLLRGLGQIKEL